MVSFVPTEPIGTLLLSPVKFEGRFEVEAQLTMNMLPSSATDDANR